MCSNAAQESSGFAVPYIAAELEEIRREGAPATKVRRWPILAAAAIVLVGEWPLIAVACAGATNRMGDQLADVGQAARNAVTEVAGRSG